MPTDLETFLAEAMERAKAAAAVGCTCCEPYDVDASQADVEPLVKIVEEAVLHLEVMHETNNLADRECFIRGADLCAEHMNRIAREASGG